MQALRQHTSLIDINNQFLFIQQLSIYCFPSQIKLFKKINNNTYFTVVLAAKSSVRRQYREHENVKCQYSKHQNEAQHYQTLGRRTTRTNLVHLGKECINAVKFTFQLFILDFMNKIITCAFEAWDNYLKMHKSIVIFDKIVPTKSDGN